jgi:hypothetical protein
MKGLIFLAVLVAGVAVLAMNPGFIADKVLEFAKQNPTYANTPDYIYDGGRACQILQGDDAALELYDYLYKNFPNNAALCAPAMYYSGKIKAESSYLKVFRVMALPYLQIVLDQYPDQLEWNVKAKQLMSEVNGDKP